MKALANDGIKAYFCKEAIEKARIKGIKVNGEKATAHNVLTTKEEGNAIYKQLKANGEITVKFDELEQGR